MYANTLAFSYALQAPQEKRSRRTMIATLAFAAGAIVGWPFSLAVAVPFVLEEMFLAGADKVTEATFGTWLADRWYRMLSCVCIAPLLFVRLVSRSSSFYT